MRYQIIELELSQSAPEIVLADDEHGVGLLARFEDQLIGFKMLSLAPRTRLSQDRCQTILDDAFAEAVLEARIEHELQVPNEPELALPGLTIAICTKDRSERLDRLLSTLVRACATSPFESTEVVVIDNAPSDEKTAETVARYPGFRHIIEPKAGLNFARNTALSNARGKLLAFLDDDVVIDRNWLIGLAKAARGRPDAGGFTGLVLPYKLDTEARVAFEARGGFGRGFRRKEWHATSFHYDLSPVGAGLLGAGCNMAFDAQLLRSLGGFDEALDTGAPLPGGGDLDIFYRVLRTGRAMVYAPRYAVYHEHRETIPQLRRQYWTWGLGLMAFLSKIRRSDPELNDKHHRMVRWWFLYQLRETGKALARLNLRDFRFASAELVGGLQGIFGEYDRSRSRIDAIKASES